MAAITEVQIERVRSLVASVPAGNVTTYGDIADAAELSSPRTVGAIMRMDSADLPWHRVLSASGKPAPHLAERQLAKLREEGVTVRDGRVDLSLVRFTFS
ncbi:MGMT family protein [Rhodococcus sp. BGS-1C]|jgi:methylated-DNA-protein-cysteine methyltransferase-like protein|uniref:MGMT family protein n=1 Tax=Nocardiaceae TaxID=85025 RepID=UPI0019D231C6|nr:MULTISPECIES: MGMT family protein [Rhodococcus]MCZ4275839.1 MGMT family protein [Rhodococcus yunnanensis]